MIGRREVVLEVFGDVRQSRDDLRVRARPVPERGLPGQVRAEPDREDAGGGRLRRVEIIPRRNPRLG